MTGIQSLNFETAAPIEGRSNAERQAAYRKRNPEKAAKNKRDYRHNNSKWQTDAQYLSRLFTAWDGEGITKKSGEHVYVMLAVKNQNDSDYLFNPKGLRTEQIFEFVLKFAAKSSETIQVIYGGGYDFNMWFVDIPRDVIQKIYDQKYVIWNGYRIAWRKGKSLYLAHVDKEGRRSESITIYDVAPFFQIPFVKACDSYLGGNFYRREVVVKNKALRSSFTVADVPEVREYNDVELINLIRLMEELRRRLNKAGLRPMRWDGPGAVASALMRREGIKKARAESPSAVAQAARFAYAGGRFEVIRFGSVEGAAYEYDINSAYPAALRSVPNLAEGTWEYVSGDPGPQEFAMYHVEYQGARSDIPGAFFRRDSNGSVCYPMNVTGWYWSPEIETGREYCQRGYGKMRVIEAWVFRPTTDVKPFAFIDRLYKARQIMKRQGDGAHVGIKLGLNSLYGKLAQQVGAEERNGVWRIPPFHQLEWAGYTTSYCRARILRACLDNIGSVIAFETDAVFVSEKLNVPESSELGDFEGIEFDSLTYVQSGMYFGTSGGEVVEKTRGVDRGSLHESDVLQSLAHARADDRYVTARLTRFIGLGVALSQNFDLWRRWQTVRKRITLEPTGKRVHGDCWCMRTGGEGIEVGRWHVTMCPMLNAAHSVEFPVMWAGGVPGTEALAELRDIPSEWI